MRAEWIVTLVWGLLLGGLLALQFLFPTHVESWELAGGAAGLTLLLAVALYPYRRRAEPLVRRIPDTSYSTVAAAAGASIAIMGFAFGAWLFLPGLGLLAFGLAGVVRELVAERRTRP